MRAGSTAGHNGAPGPVHVERDLRVEALGRVRRNLRIGPGERLDHDDAEHVRVACEGREREHHVVRVPGSFEQRDELRLRVVQAPGECTAELRAARARVGARRREVHAAVDAGLSDLVLGAGLAVRPVLEADEPEIGRP